MKLSERLRLINELAAKIPSEDREAVPIGLLKLAKEWFGVSRVKLLELEPLVYDDEAPEEVFCGWNGSRFIVGLACAETKCFRNTSSGVCGWSIASPDLESFKPNSIECPHKQRGYEE